MDLSRLRSSSLRSPGSMFFLRYKTMNLRKETLTMSDPEKKAMELFNSGHNCAQAVVAAFAETHDYDENLALGLSCGFGAGMGRMQDTCGAVTGAFMVIGISCFRKSNDPLERKESAYLLVREFSRRFKELNRTSQCRELLNCDLLTEEGRQYAKDHHLHETVCGKCITDSVRILGEMLDTSDIA